MDPRNSDDQVQTNEVQFTHDFIRESSLCNGISILQDSSRQRMLDVYQAKLVQSSIRSLSVIFRDEEAIRDFSRQHLPLNAGDTSQDLALPEYWTPFEVLVVELYVLAFNLTNFE